MGVCFDCLVVVDGIPDTRACMTWIRDGMTVSRRMPRVTRVTGWAGIRSMRPDGEGPAVAVPASSLARAPDFFHFVEQRHPYIEEISREQP